MNTLLNFFRWQNMIKPAQILGDIPDNRTIYRRTFHIAWPSAVESVLIALIGAVDLMMVGGLGSEAIAAVGITNQPKFLVLALRYWFPAVREPVCRRRPTSICVRPSC